ncbi:MAG: hypothetical protein ACK4ZJ_17370 [Allorhizobium sp.]
MLLSLNFLAEESQVFSLDLSHATVGLFSPNNPNAQAVVESVAERLVRAAPAPTRRAALTRAAAGVLLRVHARISVPSVQLR